jgi:poly(hydroxyalkanoate) depolymerase family esterase
MRDAMRLMQAGDLNAATAAIQSGLNVSPVEGAPPHVAPFAPRDCIDADFRVIADAPEDIGAEREPAGQSLPQTMRTGTFTSAEGTREYLVYAPGASPAEPSPLILMLHGCTQTAADFARGTRMHLRAADEGYVVVYPLQSDRSNPNRCWNWFRAADQRRLGGEPALLTGLVSEMARRYSCDPARIYVAGLSAGGAMAVTLGRLYPDVFHGVGAHSGLPHASAHDAASAFSAMRNGRAQVTSAAGDDRSLPRVPTIVFHGDRDPTVNVRNAAQIVDDAMVSPRHADASGEGNRCAETVSRGRVDGGHEFTTTTTRDAAGRPQAETWIVHGGGHAWFGGSSGGSFVDPKGPDASAEMLRFFRSLD